MIVNIFWIRVVCIVKLLNTMLFLRLFSEDFFTVQVTVYQITCPLTAAGDTVWILQSDLDGPSTLDMSYLWVPNNQATLFQRIIPTGGRSSGWIVSFHICGSFKHNEGTERLINKLHRNASSAVTRIRPIIIITFDTSNFVVHNGITHGIGISVSHRWQQYCYNQALLLYSHMHLHMHILAE